MSNLTSEQVDAVTHAWLDLSATSKMLSPMGRIASHEIAVAAKNSAEELETVFPFLLEEPLTTEEDE